MADIGASLREARMRQRIDVSDMEMRTKIRSKYLRALENEEWDLLPGPTYVKSFLRTYADALGLDSKLLVEEYKLRHDPLETGDLHPIRRQSARERERRRGGRDSGGGGVPRAALVGLVLAAIVVALFLIGRNEDEPAATGPVATMPAETREPGSAAPAREQESETPARPTTVRLQIVATGSVSVCLVDARGRVLVGNEILQAGDRTEPFRSRRFRLVLGNNNARLRINATSRSVPPSDVPIGYTITRNGRSELPAERQPTCQA